MPVSIAHKGIFIHIPKCAGSSINRVLIPEVNSIMGKPNQFSLRYLYGRNLQHLTAEKVRLLKPFKFHRYFKFAFVRNPYSRMLSEYKWRSDWDKRLKNVNFESFIMNLPEQRKSKDPHFLEASDFIFDRNKRLLVDFVGRFEKIDDDIATIFKHLNIQQVLGKTNVSKSKQFDGVSEHSFNHNMCGVIEDLFANDIENFGYNQKNT